MKDYIIALVGYSGSGKTLASSILNDKFGIPKVISCTTRAPRKGEKDGVDYFFLTMDEFNKKKKLEFDNYAGNYYGLLKSTVDDLLREHHHICTVTTMSGVEALHKAYPGKVYSVFINANLKRLTERLKARGEDDASIAKRLDGIREEQMNRLFCQYEVVNEDSIEYLEMALKLLLHRIETEEVRPITIYRV